MSKLYTIYIAATGAIVRSGDVFRAGDLAMQAGEGEAILEGVAGNPSMQRVNLQTLQVEDIPVVAPTLAELKASARALLADRRWQIEVAGVEIGGVMVATDDRSKLLIANAAERARADPEFTAKWKTATGEWVLLNASSIIATYGAVFAHVQNCFARESEIDGQITAAEDAAALEVLASVIAAFWE